MQVTATSFTVPDGLQVYVLIGMVRAELTHMLPSPITESEMEIAMTELVGKVRERATAQANMQLSALDDAINTSGCSAALIDIGVSTGTESDSIAERLRAELVGKVVLCRPRAEGDPVVHPQLAEGAGWTISEPPSPAKEAVVESDAEYPGLYL